MRNLFILSGLPGSGKSTWATKQNGTVISRDKVRFELLNDNDEYFAKENEVFNTWINRINSVIGNRTEENIFVDATHLNDRSRQKVLSKLNLDKIDNIILVIFNPGIEVYRSRNAQREGRARVPDDVILNMAKSFDTSTSLDCFNYILEVL